MADVLTVPPSSITLDYAKKWLRSKFSKGAECPCCKQHVRLVKRKLNSNMVRFLVSLARIHDVTQDWVPKGDCSYKGHDYNQIHHWGLAEYALLALPGAKRTSGLWRPTEKGYQFIRGEITVPTHAMTYNSGCYGYAETHISVHEANGAHFNYAEMMDWKGDS